jgi:Helicase conserved C-terminal domain
VGVSSFPGPAAVSTDVLLSGMRQAEQQAVLSGFRAGEFQVLLATCIGEEGLDIPQVGCSSGSFLAQQWQFPCTAVAVSLHSISISSGLNPIFGLDQDFESSLLPAAYISDIL